MFDYQTPTNAPLRAETLPDVAPASRVMTRRRIDSRRLLSGSNELVIEHAGQEYRLRLTRNDKLILTK